MVRMLRIAFNVSFASIILAGAEPQAPPSAFSASSPSHRHGIDNQFKNATVLPRSDTVKRTKRWMEQASLGRSHYLAWQSKPMSNTEPSWSVPAEFAERVESKSYYELHDEVQELLEELSVAAKGEPDTWRLYKLNWPKQQLPVPVHGATFTCNVNVEKGVFLARDIFSGDMPAGWSFADIAWYVWSSAVQHAADTAGSGSKSQSSDCYDYSQLGYFFIDTWNWDSPAMFTKENYFTYFLLKEIFREDILYPTPEAKNPGGDRGSGGDEGSGGNEVSGQEESVVIATQATKVFLPDDVDKAFNPFWVLLGSPHVASIIAMLTEHKDDFAGYGITSLSVKMVQYEGKHTPNPTFIVWAEIGADE